MDKKYDGFIEYALQKLDIQYIKKTKYYICRNPVTIVMGGKDRTMSACWYRQSGSLRVFNSDTINNKDFISINELVSFLKLKDTYEQLMSMSLSEVKTFYNKNNVIKKEVDKTIPTEEVKQTKDEYQQGLQYLKSRKIKEEFGLIEVVTLLVNGSWRKVAIAFRYPNGFSKYRYITGDKKFRYTSKGEYREFFCAYKNNKNKRAMVQEGEIDSISSSYHTKTWDIYSLHNLRAVCETDTLMKYNQILILLDIDKFDKVKDDVLAEIKKITNPNCKIIIRPKLRIFFKGEYSSDVDYNDLHVNGMLDKNTILSGYLSKKHIENKVGFENCEYYEKYMLTKN